MAYRVTSDAAKSGRPGPRFAAHRRGDRAVNRSAILSGVALSCLALASAGVLVLGRAHDPGSVASYTASQKSLKVALVEPAQQAQMEASTAVAWATPSGPDVRIKTAAVDIATPVVEKPVVEAPASRPRAAKVARVPMPPVKPAQLAAKLPEPIIVATTSNNTNLADPPPQRSPTREEGEGLGATALPEAEAAAVAAASDTAENIAPETRLADASEHNPVPTTFGPARQTPSMQLVSYAPTSEQIFQSDITGSIGNPLRDLDKLNAAEPKPLPNAAAATPPKLAAVTPAKPVLRKPRALTVQEKLWGSPVRVASLTPMDNVRESSNAARGNIPTMPYDRQTAVYVITHRKVYLPDGTELEAHSGLGPKMDDPRYAHVRMHGVTPPHVYNLKMREALFHGVEAIRMLPIGGSDEIFGRDGILAHTYLLGPNGQSNGCVSIRNYDAFLDAFKDGKITRMAVLARLD
jgi:hypothetical protein